MNYDTASDFEINKAVAEALGYEVIPRISYTGRFMEAAPESVWHIKPNHEHREHQDYCNNPSDMWPIILENRISLDAIEDEHDKERYWSAIAPNGSQFSAITWGSKNPLRAACIVYLKMKAAKTYNCDYCDKPINGFDDSVYTAFTLEHRECHDTYCDGCEDCEDE